MKKLEANSRAFAAWGPRTLDRAQSKSGNLCPVREREEYERHHLSGTDAGASTYGGRIRKLPRRENGWLSSTRCC